MVLNKEPVKVEAQVQKVVILKKRRTWAERVALQVFPLRGV